MYATPTQTETRRPGHGSAEWRFPTACQLPRWQSSRIPRRRCGQPSGGPKGRPGVGRRAPRAARQAGAVRAPAQARTLAAAAAARGRLPPRTRTPRLPARAPTPSAPGGQRQQISSTRTCPSALPTAAILEFGEKSALKTGLGSCTRAPKASVLFLSGRWKNLHSFSCEPPAMIMELPGSLLNCAAKSMQVFCVEAVRHSTVSASSPEP
mmetsp:Transcript_57392/g.114989  ORF Transcript_57392/g.114989 Transcript_57392/m.114989 type:complete len:209 (+) Transcript_57392:136-762(+)